MRSCLSTYHSVAFLDFVYNNMKISSIIVLTFCLANNHQAVGIMLNIRVSCVGINVVLFQGGHKVGEKNPRVFQAFPEP